MKTSLRFSVLSSFCLMFLWLATASAQAQITRYVSATGTNTNPASATSWATSTTNLQGAINSLSATGGAVWVARGLYKPTTGTDRSISFSMRSGVSILGGFVGTETALVDRVLTYPLSTTLSGELGDPASTTDNSYHLISNPSGLTTTAILDGFVITGGSARADGTDFSNNAGGGVYNNGNGPGQVCSPSFRNCFFIGNRASAGSGGAIYNDGQNGGNSSPQLTNCFFQDNQAQGIGGAILNNGAGGGISSPQLNSCAFLNNRAGNNGGAIYNNGNDGTSSPQLTNCSFQGNQASSSGGAMYNDGQGGTSSPQLKSCVFWNNAVVSNSASVTATYSLFENASGVDISGPGNFTTATSPFVSASDMTLATGSPAIDAGDPASSTRVTLSLRDVLGNPRLVGCAIDMGAVESSMEAKPTRLYVNANAPVDGNGLSWSSPFRDLQKALFYFCRQNLTEIWVAAGTYTPITGLPFPIISSDSRTISFAMRNGLAIYGGFVGNETALNQRPAINPVNGQPSSSTLSGEIGDPNSTTDNTYHVVLNDFGMNLNNTAVLDGFVITGGNANRFPEIGGGIRNDGTNRPTIINCSLQNNQATSYGGGICDYGGMILTNCSLQNNTASLGGAMYMEAPRAAPVLTNCSFQNNRAGNGGAIHNYGSSPIVTNCHFQNNTAINSGGGFDNDQGSPKFRSCSLQNNVAPEGGAIRNGGDLTMTNCNLQNNQATRGGGIYNQYSYGCSITNCSLQNNTAQQGGAIYNADSDYARLTNCSLQSNTANQGGAFYNALIPRNPGYSPNQIQITNCVMWGNGGNGAIVNESAGNVTSTLIATYSLFDPSSSTVLGVTVSGPGNLTNVATSPFVSLSSVALNACSPAIDAGNSVSYTAASSFTIDLVGNPRIVGPTIDMGAVEFQDTPNQQVGITGQPATGASACAGGMVTASVSVSGSVASYQWFRGNTPVADQTTAILSLANVQATDTGSYSVVVTGGCNSVTSSNFTLMVNPSPTATITFPNSVTVAGSPVPIVRVPALNPPVVFQASAGAGLPGSSYERVSIVDRINGYEIRQNDSNTTGIFPITRLGLFTLTVTGAGGCKRTVQWVVEQGQ